MIIESILLFILLLAAASIWSIQIAGESTLALQVKSFLRLTQPYNKKLSAFSQFKFWRKLIGTAFYILFPLVLIIVLALKFHHFLSELFDCPYCTSTWIFFFLQLLLTSETILYCIIFAPLAIIGCYIIERIRR
jgi:hypothetical protein